MIVTIAIIITALALIGVVLTISEVLNDIRRKRRSLYVGARWHRRDTGESGKITALFWDHRGIVDEVAWSSDEVESRIIGIIDFLRDWEPSAK